MWFQTGTRCSYMIIYVFICDNMFFPSVCPRSPRTSILPMQKGNMNVNFKIHISEVWSTIPHWPNRQSCRFVQEFLASMLSTQEILVLDIWPPCPRLFLCLSTTFLCLSTIFDCARVGPSQKTKLIIFFPSNCSHVQAQHRSAEEKKQSLKTTSGSSWGPKLVRILAMNCDQTSSQFMKHRGPIIAHVRFLSIPCAPNLVVYLLRSFVYLLGLSRKRCKRPSFGESQAHRVWHIQNQIQTHFASGTTFFYRLANLFKAFPKYPDYPVQFQQVLHGGCRCPGFIVAPREWVSQASICYWTKRREVSKHQKTWPGIRNMLWVLRNEGKLHGFSWQSLTFWVLFCFCRVNLAALLPSVAH